jgi:cyclase
VQCATELEARGVGEIVACSIDRDGTMGGYDLTLAREVSDATRVPVTLAGGAGSLEDFRKAIGAVGPVGLAAGSLFVFKGVHRAVLINYPARNERDGLSPHLV